MLYHTTFEINSAGLEITFQWTYGKGFIKTYSLSSGHADSILVKQAGEMHSTSQGGKPYGLLTDTSRKQ